MIYNVELVSGVQQSYSVTHITIYTCKYGASQVAQWGKNPPANAGDAGLTPGLWAVSLEEEMATHCGILAWRIPWTEEPGGLQSTGSQKVGHD